MNTKYLLIRTGWRLMSLLPFWAIYLISDLIYFPLYYVARYRRKVVRKNLTNSFPEKTEKEIIRIEKRFYSAFCDYLMETVKLMDMSPKTVKKHMRFEGLEELERLVVKEGKSCVLYMGHNFNWELVTSLPLHFKDESNIRFGQIYHPLTDKNMDKLFIELREQYGSECIPMARTLRRIAELEKQKALFVIGFIADQVPYWEAINHWVDFLHQDTPVFNGTEKIARRTHSSVFYFSVRKEKRGHYVGKFELLTEDASTTSTNELTECYFKLLEDGIKKEPHLWLWTHKRWKRTREGYEAREAQRILERQRYKNNANT